MTLHDSGYKLLFSHPRLVQDLITGFVQPDWLNSIDFNTLEPYKASFVTDDLRQRHDDSIWRLKFKETWLYLYLLLEFQSSDDYFMANRVMTYVGLLYQDIIHAESLSKGDCLPPVLPIVLYNGLSNWSGPLNTAEKLLPATSGQFGGSFDRFRALHNAGRNARVYPTTAPATESSTLSSHPARLCHLVEPVVAGKIKTKQHSRISTTQ